MAGPLGTLIVVVLKARNLPNKQRIGKQDPYATCTYLSHRKRTKTDKRGGQHPVWDDELRFDIYDNPKDAMASASVSTTATGGVVPVKSNAASVGSVGATSLKELRVAVYADDPRDPDLIGEGKVDLTETLKKGEFDDWVTVTNKGKYQGEVYLEMTFYSAKPPPDKLQTPTGPIRAGVFEACSPGSGKRPTPIQPAAHSLNKKHSPSPSCMPSKTINPDHVPAALRAGRPLSGATSPGRLPFPGEPSTSKDASLNSRQRSTGSLSMPAPDFGPENRPPSRAPSRNHSLDLSDHHEHPTPQYMDPSYPDRFPQSPQPQRATRPSLAGRRPLPIPGGDSVHRPPSAWGNSQNIPGGQRYVNEVPVLPQQPPPATYSQYPEDYERPPTTVPVMTNGGPTYPPPQMQYADGHNPPNAMHPHPTANPPPPPHAPYSSQQPQYYPNPPPPQNPPFAAQTAHVPYNLPPPPAGQAPVPIHEVFASSSGRPLPPANPNGYLPPGSFPAQHSQQQVVPPPPRPNTGGETVYTYQGFQHHNQTYNPPIDHTIPNHNNLYQSQNAPPPPPLHQQQQMKYQPFPNNTNVQVPIPSPSAPPSTQQMYYHPPTTYAPPPTSTPEPSFNPQRYQQEQHYPEHNNPFHVPQRSQSVMPGEVYTRPSLSSSSSLPPQPSSSLPNTHHHLSHPPSNLPFYYSAPYPHPTPSYTQT